MREMGRGLKIERDGKGAQNLTLSLSGGEIFCPLCSPVEVVEGHVLLVEGADGGQSLESGGDVGVEGTPGFGGEEGGREGGRA